MKKIMAFVCLFITLHSSAQDSQNANWCFPLNAGVNFNTVTPTATASNINFSNPGGSIVPASVSDNNGNLRFYTDGINIWDATHTIMTNGTGLYGFSDRQTQQKVVIVPKPYHDDIYYIFTLGSIDISGGGPTIGHGGIHYSVVDMSLGNGAVVLKNIPLKNQNGDFIDYVLDRNHTNDNPVFISTRSRMTTTVNSGGDKIWVSVIPDFYYQGLHTKKFFNFLITANGISEDGITAIPDGTSSKPLVETGINQLNYPNVVFDITSMKISPNGQYLCDAEDAVNLYNYNNATGTISFNRNVFTPGSSPIPTGYGLDFSPNSQLIYFTYIFSIIQNGRANGSQLQPGSRNYISLYQYKIGPKPHLEIIYTYLPSQPIVTPIPIQGVYGLQLAMNHKIYVCAEGPSNQYINYLGVINSPDVQGTGCNFVPDGLQLLPNTYEGLVLPQWVHKAKGTWPKVYEWGTKLSGSLTKDNFGNIFYSFYSDNMQNNLHHNGAGSSNPNSFFTAQYDQNTGYTNWIKPDYRLSPGACLANGDIRLSVNSSPPTFSHFNSTSGLPVSNTTTLANTEIVRIETTSGEYLTYDQNSYIFRFHPASGIPVSLPYRIQTYFYSPVTSNLYTESIHTTGNSGQAYFDVYHIANGTVTLTHSTIRTASWYLLNLDNSENLYVVSNTTNNTYLEKYDYLTNTFSPVVINNFNNSNLIPLSTPNYYPSDYLLVYNKNDNKLYSLNFNNNSVRSMSTSNFENFGAGGVLSNYIYVGNDLFLSGVIYNTQDIILGNQTITPLSANSNNRFNSNFLTKFNINSDFNFRQAFESNLESQPNAGNTPAFNVSLFPNPATSSLRIGIIEPDKIKNPVYTLSIRSSSGNILLKKERYIPNSDLNITTLDKGMYFVEIINEKGEKVIRNLVKL